MNLIKEDILHIVTETAKYINEKIEHKGEYTLIDLNIITERIIRNEMERREEKFNEAMKKTIKRANGEDDEILENDPCPCGTQQLCPENGCQAFKNYWKSKEAR